MNSQNPREDARKRVGSCGFTESIDGILDGLHILRIASEY